MPFALSTSLSTARQSNNLEHEEAEEIEANESKKTPTIYMIKKEDNIEKTFSNSPKMNEIEKTSSNGLHLAHQHQPAAVINEIPEDECETNHFSTTFPHHSNVDVSLNDDANEKQKQLLEIKREQQINSRLNMNRLNVNRNSTKGAPPKFKSDIEMANSVESSEVSLNSSNMSSTETSFILVNDKLVHRGLQTSNTGEDLRSGVNSFDSSRRSSSPKKIK